VTSWVTVDHENSLPIWDIQHALEDAGFDISDITTDSKQPTTVGTAGKSHTAVDSDIGYLDRLIYRLGSDDDSAKYKHAKNQHLQNCDVCRREGQHHIPDAKIPKPSSILEDGRKDAMHKPKDNVPLVVVDSHASEITETIWRVSLAIGGMTCAACSTAITSELEKKNWIQNAVVNLISNSATVDFVGEEHKTDIVEAIEDIGYDTTIDSVVDINKLQEDGSKTVYTFASFNPPF
jgi:P-type Cu+ transporter